jgi:hypothetical protein
MIKICLNHITACLTQIGISYVFVDDDNINDHKGAKYAGVYTNTGSITKDGSRVGKEDDLENMKRTYRRRIYILEYPFNIILVDTTKALVQEHMNNLLLALGQSIKDEENNLIELTVTNITWMEERSKLRSRSGVEMTINFTGGIYHDQQVTLVDLSTTLSIETDIGGTVNG